MTSFPLWGWILIALSTFAIAKNNEHRNLERAVIELNALRGDAEITYSDEWKSKADVLYAKKKKLVAYKDAENELCLLEKLEQRDSVSEGHFSRQFHIVNRTLDKDQLEKLAGKKILNFCAKLTSIVLKRYPRDGRRGKSNRAERMKREAYPLQKNESQISHQEGSKRLLENLVHTQSVISSRSSHGKDLKRNVDGKTENSRTHYPSSSAKIAYPPGIDYHTHIRNNIFPGTHAVHPIDITSSVTITTGSSQKVWPYPSSSGGYHNSTATSQPSGTSHSPHSSHQNTSHDASAHDAQRPSFSLHHPYPSSLSQNQGLYPPSDNSKSQQSLAIYPPSSTSKTLAPEPYPPSSVSKNHQGRTFYPPSATSKSQQLPGYFVPSSTSKMQPPAHYPPSATTKTQRPSEYFPPSSSTKAQLPSYYLPSAAPKYQPFFGHYPPSSSSKTQGPGSYPPSATSKPQSVPAHYPPSSFTKSQQGKVHYASSTASKPEHGHEHYPPSSFSTPQYYPPSATDKTHHAGGHYPPSSVSKPVHDQYPPSSTSKSHQMQQNITSDSQSGGGRQYPPITAKLPFSAQYSPSGSHSLHHVATSHLQRPSHVSPSSTSKIHYHPQNGTHFQYNTLYSYGVIPGMYAPQFPPSSTSKLYSPQFLPSPDSFNYVPQSENQGVHHRKYPHSFAQYPHSSTAKFHTKLDQSGGNTPHFPPSSTTKIRFPVNVHDTTAPVLEKPSVEGSPHGHGRYPMSSGAKEYPGVDDVPQYPPSSASKASYVPSSSHIYGGTDQGHVHPPLRSALPSPPSGSVPPAQIPQPPVSGHFHSSLHIHSFPTQYYPPSASVKHSPKTPHSQTQGPVAYYPSSTAKLHPVPNQNVSKHLPPRYFPPSSTSRLHPSSVGHRYDFPSGPLAHSQVPYYPPSAFSKNPLNEGGHSHPQHYPRYPPSSSSYHMHNGSSIGSEKSLSPSSVGHIYSQPQYLPSSSSRLHPNASENTYPSPTMPLYPSGGQHYPFYSHSPYNVTVSHHHQYQQPSIALQPRDDPQFQQGSTTPCQGSLYSVTTRTTVTPNGVIQRPVSVKNNGESPCGNKQGTTPYTIPCGSIIKNGHSVKLQNPCTSNQPNQGKSMRNVLVPGPAMIPGKKTAEQNELGSSDGVIITNVGESEAEVLDGIGYPVPHQQFSHLKENSTYEEVEDLEGEMNQTKSANAGEKEKVEDITEETSAKQEEEKEEEVKEGDVLEPGDKILGKNGYMISDGFRGRVVSVSGQVGKTRTTKGEKKSNSGQFKYSPEWGRYLKDDGGKRFSDCHGEVTFTCSEFLGSNGRAKICKPNPRRNPDGSPC